jgi:hypothetical protein
MKRDELIAQLMQCPNDEVVFVANVWSPMGACYDKRIVNGVIQRSENPALIVINVTV